MPLLSALFSPYRSACRQPEHPEGTFDQPSAFSAPGGARIHGWDSWTKVPVRIRKAAENPLSYCQTDRARSCGCLRRGSKSGRPSRPRRLRHPPIARLTSREPDFATRSCDFRCDFRNVQGGSVIAASFAEMLSSALAGSFLKRHPVIVGRACVRGSAPL